MSEELARPQPSSFAEAIALFLQERECDKTEKLDVDDPKRQEIKANFLPAIWIADAAKRVAQIQMATHALKAIHPDAKGTNLFVPPSQLPKRSEVGSHVLSNDFAQDVVGNAAALDVYKFLKLSVDGRTLLSALLERDPQALAALSADAEQANALRDAFVGVTQVGQKAASHNRAKQVYWLRGDDPCDGVQYVLLAPLFPTSLVHEVHHQIQEALYGEEQKNARKAQREGRHYEGEVQHYTQLAIRKLGGTNQQNVSQLNSVRRGVNYLLASLPPLWQQRSERLPVHANSIFDNVYGARPHVHATVKQLKAFLLSDPPPTQVTRLKRTRWVDALVEEALLMAKEIQEHMPAGWSQNDAEQRFINLNRAEQLWLDPYAAGHEDVFHEDWIQMDWPMQVARHFAFWLNKRLEPQLKVGDPEMREWAREFALDWQGFRARLRSLRSDLEAPHYVPISAGVQTQGGTV